MKELAAEAALLIGAGSDTTSMSLSGTFFCLTGNPPQYQKLVEEIRTKFETAEEMMDGPKLLDWKYLKACIDEGMRIAPSGPCDSPREVLSGGIRIHGNYYPEGTIDGTVPWILTRDELVFEDPGSYRPER